MRILTTTLGKFSSFGAAVLLCGGMAFAQPCLPVYTTGTDDGDLIDGVELEDISNVGSGGEITDIGYSDYTDLSTELMNGETYIMTVTNGPDWSSTVTAWIDYNHDDEFTDDEVIGNLSLGAGISGEMEFTVDILALAGPTTMRVRGIYPSGLGTPLDPCASATYGEAEDYTVELSGGPDNNLSMDMITSPSSGADLGTVSVTVEITNTGADPASDFEVSYMVDMAVVATETYTMMLDPGATGSYTFATEYTFPDYGCYDFEASLVWAEDGFEGDNAASKTVCNAGPVTGTGSVYIRSNVPFGEPWGSTSIIDAMDAAVGDYTDTYYEEDVFNGENCFVYMEGSDGHANELETFLDENIGVIEGWVEGGGRLFINAAPNEGDGMSLGFGGTELIYSYFTSTAEAEDASHPIFMGPFTPVGTVWTGGSFGHARIEGEDLNVLIVDQASPDNIVLAEKFYGSGQVVFGGMTTTNYHSPATEAFNLRANIISYLSCAAAAVCLPPDDVTLDVLTSTTASFSWSPVDGADQYVLAIRNNTTGNKNSRQFDVTAYTFSSLTPGDSYSFRVKSVCFTDLGTISGPSDQVDFTTPLRVGMAETGVNVYPNPSNGTFRIQLNDYVGADVQVRIVNTIGQVVYSNIISVMDAVTVEEVQLNVEPGTYLVQVLSGNEVTINPVVIE